MKTFKTRHQFYLPDDLSEKLDTMAAKPGSSKTAILTDALTAWFDRRAGSELDQRFGTRLDRQSRTSDRIEDKIDVLSESLAVFVRHHLLITAHQPDYDAATRQLGKARYEAYVELVGRGLARKQAAPAPEGAIPPGKELE